VLSERWWTLKNPRHPLFLGDLTVMTHRDPVRLPVPGTGAARTVTNVLTELLCGGNARSSPTIRRITSGSPIDSLRMQNRTFNALFQNALSHKEHNDGEHEQTV
jgi:hypothetical protein